MKTKLILSIMFVFLVAGHCYAYGTKAASEPAPATEPAAASEPVAPAPENNQVANEQPAVPVEVGNKICPVSGNPVGQMGPAIKYTYNGKIYNLCCPMCVRSFKNNPEKYSKIAQDEVAAQK